MIDDARRALREHFGFERFRPGQAEAVAAVTGPAAPRDVLVVMPTGAGKSLCYQLPALMREDLTVVVSPLVSLMQDQVEALERVAPGSAALVNAQQDAGINRAALARAARGELQLLYVAPERFSSPAFLEQIREARVGLFVVDEAHCVSQWGHDFRPDYFRLADAARWLGAGAIVASTATATPQVAADIVARLGLRDPVRVATGFDRPNLSFAVVRCGGAADKRRRLVAALADPAARPAIVYAGTRSETERLAAELSRELGLEALAYHAGLRRDQRAAAQQRFMAGEVEVVVATNAFGMGVDKADVRTVAHAGVPGSVEAYYQEAGRAGRDGAPGARAAARRGARQGPARLLHPARGGRRRGDRLRRRAPRAARRATGATTSASTSWGTSPTPCARSSATSRARACWCPRPRRPTACAGASPRRSTAARAPPAARRPPRRSARAGASTARSGRSSRATAAGARRSCGTSATGAPAPAVACCDVCAPELVPAPAAPARLAPALAGDLDGAILEVVDAASPPVGRTRAVEILRGGRSKVVARYAYDGLPGYGAFAHLSSAEVLERVDELLADGRLRLDRRALPEARTGPPVARGVTAPVPLRVGVLASGAGTNLQALLDTVHGREAQVVAVASDQPGCAALERARAAAIPARAFPLADHADRAARDAAIADWLEQEGVELVVLAGYMALLSPAFIARFPDRIVNVHPSLLPAFPGLRAIEQALEYGVQVFGVTVHLVDEGVDTGPILLQGAIAIARAPTPSACTPRCGRSSTACCPRPCGSSPPAACAATGGGS